MSSLVVDSCLSPSGSHLQPVNKVNLLKIRRGRQRGLEREDEALIDQEGQAKEPDCLALAGFAVN